MALKTRIMGAALAAAALLTTPAAAQTVVKHASSPAGLILQSVTVKPGATTLYLSGQLAAPLDPTKKVPPAQLSIADFGDTKTQTLSVLGKIKAILAEHGFAMRDIVKLTVFVAGDPKLGDKMDFAGMNDGFKQYFGTAENPTTVARSTIQVAALAGPAYLVEIEATAAK
jgi:enamine deaminase RidA (YjgF/YER057c/UK114 family)